MYALRANFHKVRTNKVNCYNLNLIDFPFQSTATDSQDHTLKQTSV